MLFSKAKRKENSRMRSRRRPGRSRRRRQKETGQRRREKSQIVRIKNQSIQTRKIRNGQTRTYSCFHFRFYEFAIHPNVHCGQLFENEMPHFCSVWFRRCSYTTILYGLYGRFVRMGKENGRYTHSRRISRDCFRRIDSRPIRSIAKRSIGRPIYRPKCQFGKSRRRRCH